MSNFYSDSWGLAMKELLGSFLEKPTSGQYLELRQQVMEWEGYDPYSNDLEIAEQLLDEGKLSEAADIIHNGMPNLILSPSAHLLISIIWEKQGNEETSELERYVAMACCEGMMLTGDGSRQSPYQILRTSDEYDVLHYLGKEFARQALVEDNGRYFDKLTVRDGAELWFEITDMYLQLSAKLSNEEPK